MDSQSVMDFIYWRLLYANKLLVIIYKSVSEQQGLLLIFEHIVQY